MNGLFLGVLLGFLVYPWLGPVGVLLGGTLGFLSDVSSGRRPGLGSETRELVHRLFALWGTLAGHGGGLSPVQALFLQSVLTNQLRLSGPLGREALATFEEARAEATTRAFTDQVAEVTSLAREIREDFFLDHQTLLWIYATARRLAALGTVRPGLVELLDAAAKSLGIWDEVGSAGVEGARSEGQYEQAWQNFRPGASAGPEAYAVLGLSPQATVDDIKKAYRALVRTHHPDAHSHLPDHDPQKKKAAETFLQIQQAYERIRQARQF